MNDKILNELKKIEEKNNVKIIFACESGSRAWGFESKDSDYDVRFVYVRSRDEYLRLDSNRDVIEHCLNDELDINGWDLFKALKLMYSSNPVLFEWINSPIQYLTTSYYDKLKTISDNYLDFRKGIYHYLSMAKSTYEAYLLKDKVKVKKYFYVLRPILACLWIIDEQSNPPVTFNELLYSKLDKELVPIVEQLIEIKKQASETNLMKRSDRLNKYILEKIQYIKEKTDYLPYSKSDYKDLNKLFLEGLDFYDSNT